MVFNFLDLGSRDAVDKALQRLAKAESIRRVCRGLYDLPRFNKLTQKLEPADPRSVIAAVGRRDQVRLLVDGMTAANDLGLTDAVPSKIVVHTDARLSAVQLGNITITFKPTAASKLFWADRPGMRVVQALHWLHDQMLRAGEADQVRRRLSKILSEPTSGDKLRVDLAENLTALPTWMQVFLEPLLALEELRMTGSDGLLLKVNMHPLISREDSIHEMRVDAVNRMAGEQKARS